MIKFINAYGMFEREEEDYLEIKNLLSEGLIKRISNGEPYFIVSEENLNKVERFLTQYKNNGTIEFQSPKEFAKESYAYGGYDIEVKLDYSHASVELGQVLDNIENEIEVFTQSEMEKVYNADDVDEAFRKLLDKITREFLKEKLIGMSKLVDNVSLWR